MEAHKKLKVEILMNGIKQLEISQMLGWDPSLLSKILNGWIPISKETETQIKTAISKIKDQHGIK